MYRKIIYEYVKKLFKIFVKLFVGIGRKMKDNNAEILKASRIYKVMTYFEFSINPFILRFRKVSVYDPVDKIKLSQDNLKIDLVRKVEKVK